MTESQGEIPAFTVLAGNPSEAELAAVTAVVTAMAEEAGQRRMTTHAGPGAWERSVTRLRGEIIPGPGAWNSREF